jgi:hypothetical protein
VKGCVRAGYPKHTVFGRTSIGKGPTDEEIFDRSRRIVMMASNWECERHRPARSFSTASIRIHVSLSRCCAFSRQFPQTATRMVRSLAPAESIAETLVIAGFKTQHSHMRSWAAISVPT